MGHLFNTLLCHKPYDVFAAAWPATKTGNVINSYRK